MTTLIPETKRLLSLPIDTLLSLEQANIPGGAYALRPIDDQHVQDLLQTDMDSWEPIRVTKTDLGYVIIDGYHRRKTARLRGATMIRAVCESFENTNDLVESCFRANLKHGLKASVGNRSDYAYWLNLTYPDLTQKEIAVRAQISQAMVSKAIAKREALLNEDEDEQEEPGQNYKKLVKRILSAYTDFEAMPDTDILQAFQAVIKPADKSKLVRVGRLFSQL